jgi:hypothetical protein
LKAMGVLPLEGRVHRRLKGRGGRSRSPLKESIWEEIRYDKDFEWFERTRKKLMVVQSEKALGGRGGGGRHTLMGTFERPGVLRCIIVN